MENQNKPFTASRFIAVCDVLGFKDMLSAVSLDELFIRYNVVVANLERTVRSNNRLLPEMADEYDLVHSAIFSDTVLVWSAPMAETKFTFEDLPSISVFFDTCSSIVSSGIFFGFPFRLGISYGEVAIDPDRNVFVGSPIANAHILEASQEWIGGACHNSCFNHPEFHRTINDWCDVIDYDVPLKSGAARLPALNWPKSGCRKTKVELNELMPLHSDDRTISKYKHAEQFFDFAWRTHNSHLARKVLRLSDAPSAEDSQEIQDRYSEILNMFNASLPP